jgi:hypothetical protein
VLWLLLLTELDTLLAGERVNIWGSAGAAAVIVSDADLKFADQRHRKLNL